MFFLHTIGDSIQKVQQETEDDGRDVSNRLDNTLLHDDLAGPFGTTEIGPDGEGVFLMGIFEGSVGGRGDDAAVALGGRDRAVLICRMT